MGSPFIASFDANPTQVTAGQASTLSWGLVSNANSAVIDQGIGGVATSRSTVVQVGQTTTFTMVATGCGGTVTKQATITVGANPPGPDPAMNLGVKAFQEDVNPAISPAMSVRPSHTGYGRL